MNTGCLHPARGRISGVSNGSAAEAAGLLPGDLLVSLNGHAIRDVIDYHFFLEAGANELVVDRDGRTLTIGMHLEEGADPGVTFDSAIFDRIRTCRSHCGFCFIRQLPRGLRRSLYLKDDDFRLSFLYGNFITLGNLEEEDIERIVNQRLSPLYVSVHATDPVVRARLMCTSVHEAAHGLDLLRRLGEGGIRTHIQIVFCPGVNDGAMLEQTITDLADNYRNVGSVAVVPAALDMEFLQRGGRSSRRGEAVRGLRPVTSSDCEDVLKLITARQEDYRQVRGTGFVYAADEFYLRASWPLPDIGAYDDFPQYENGVGIAASFLAEAEDTVRDLLAAGDTEVKEGGGAAVVRQQAADKTESRVYLLSGVLATGLMQTVCDRLSRSLGRELRPLIVSNRTFGPHVTVTGLLGGGDILSAAQAAGLGPGDLLFIPRACLSDDDLPRFVDDVSLDELEEKVGCTIIVSP